jgi:D-alanine transaminase
MLPGITYDVVLELAQTNAIPHEVRVVSEEELRTAEEVLLTSSTKEVMPIVSLDGKTIGDGKPGAMFKQLNQLYQQYKAATMRGGDAVVSLK